MRGNWLRAESQASHTLVLITGLLAAAGNLFFVGAPPALFAVAEGMAAGAMLTMIAQTMLPEAYFKGGSIIGLATLLGSSPLSR